MTVLVNIIFDGNVINCLRAQLRISNHQLASVCLDVRHKGIWLHGQNECLLSRSVAAVRSLAQELSQSNFALSAGAGEYVRVLQLIH